MAKFQVCTAGLEAPCASRLISKPVLTLSRNTCQHPSTPKVSTGKFASAEVDECKGALNLQNSGAEESPRVASLKRSRQDEDESSASRTEMSPPNEDDLSFVNKYQEQNHLTADELPVSNIPSVPASRQPVMSESNGHASLPTVFELQNFGSDTHSMPECAPQGGLLYPQVPGPGSYLGANLTFAEVLAELERTKRENIELHGHIKSLQAKLSKEDKHGCAFSNGSKKTKKLRKADRNHGERDDEDGLKTARSYQSPLSAVKQEAAVVPKNKLVTEDIQPENGQNNGVNWMIKEEVTPADLEKLNSMISERDESGDSDDDDDDDEDEEEEEEDQEGKEEERETKKRKVEGSEAWEGVGSGEERKDLEMAEVRAEAGGRLASFPSSEKHQDEDESEYDMKKRKRKKRRVGKKGWRGEKTFPGKRGFGQELSPFRTPGIMASYKKAPKTAFCPKEVKRIMESYPLSFKNAQSHTMRKIIVFASLGIRHGCEDLYELDFNHFSIVQRGEPFKSAKEPGEHVLYDHPGVRKKIFYPNRQNSILCPVKILDEERAMRPAGPSCPSCLFLCIKYGGRTRNLPQNEYVRQRMGRNKLKSFGPLMCQMAFLVHMRTGSFFFKALGITLLFMAGFPDDLVRKETKYRNLDLLQKYYRSDEDAKQDVLFHPCPPFFLLTTTAGPVPQKSTFISTKIVGKKGPPPLLSKPPVPHTGPRYLQPLPTRAPSNPPFRGPPVAFAPPLPPGPTVPPTSGTHGNPSPPCSHPPPFAMYPGYAPVQRAAGGFAPLPLWPPVNSYPPPPGAYPPPPPYAYSPYVHSSQYGSQAFYGPPYAYHPFAGHPLVSKKEVKKETEGTESDSASDSSSSGAGQKSEEKGNSSDSKDAQ